MFLRCLKPVFTSQLDGLMYRKMIDVTCINSNRDTILFHDMLGFCSPCFVLYQHFADGLDRHQLKIIVAILF